MSRDIKFRVWDKHMKEFINVDDGTLSDISYYAEAGRICFIDKYYDYQQYTGLKDKNGKEIYEGDIVKAEGWNPQYFQIEFIEGGFCGTYPDCYIPTDINHFYSSKGCSIEVVGNIYENADLLIR